MHSRDLNAQQRSRCTGLTFLLWEGVGQGEGFTLVDRAGVHEYRHVLMANVHIVWPQFHIRSVNVMDNSPELVDSFWKKKTKWTFDGLSNRHEN